MPSESPARTDAEINEMARQARLKRTIDEAYERRRRKRDDGGDPAPVAPTPRPKAPAGLAAGRRAQQEDRGRG